jgi:hypothetical protein
MDGSLDLGPTVDPEPPTALQVQILLAVTTEHLYIPFVNDGSSADESIVCIADESARTLVTTKGMFIYADKSRLLECVEACLFSNLVLKKGGYIIVADNALWKSSREALYWIQAGATILLRRTLMHWTTLMHWKQ